MAEETGERERGAGEEKISEGRERGRLGGVLILQGGARRHAGARHDGSAAWRHSAATVATGKMTVLQKKNCPLQVLLQFGPAAY